MKKVFIIFLIMITSQLCVVNLFSQSVAINSDGTIAHGSAMLDIKSSTKGMLIPRMSSAERTGIANPAAGLLVYDNQTESFWFYKSVVGWTELVTGGGGGTNYWTTNGTNIFNNNSGNVGVGVPIPLSKLHVGGNVKINGASTIEFGAGVVKESSAGKIGYQSFGTNNALDIIGAGTLGSNRKIKFWNEGGASFSGNVGIGTDNPTYRLSVNGNIRSKEVVVETGWADYVFHKKYKLRSLDEVEKFIEQNKHLPGIPSATEVEKNGLHLGDIQKKMMEKIEELTLYIIQLNKRIEELEKK